MKKCILILLNLLLTGIGMVHAQRSESYGGAMLHENDTKCLTDEDRQAIRLRLQINIASLSQDKLLFDPSRSGDVAFEFPLQWNEGFDDYGFYGISNYVDQSGPSFIEDYNCGERSYDGHRGIDYYLWPFSWQLVEEEAVQIVAAAAGVIIGKDDGYDYHSCANSSNPWNAVYLMHEDGSTTWYGHMKTNTLTSKSVGQSVEAGEYLGIVGSSGNSSGPHLHFETYDNGSLVDPYAGDCNTLNAESWWIDQRPYYDPALNKIQTHFAPPDFGICPELEVTNESDEFEPGEQVYFVVYLKDQQSSNLCLFSITEPNGQVFDSWTFNSPHPFLSSSYWYWTYTIPLNAPEGTWAFKCQFAGKLYTHNFSVGDVSAVHEEIHPLKDLTVYAGKDEITLTANSEFSFDGEIYLSDVVGRRLHQSSFRFLPGGNITTIPIDNTLHGIYFVTLISEEDNVVHTKKVWIPYTR